MSNYKVEALRKSIRAFQAKRRAVLVRCRQISADNRVACAIHVSVPESKQEPHWLMVPINLLAADQIKGVAIVYKNGKVVEVDMDDHSRSFVVEG